MDSYLKLKQLIAEIEPDMSKAEGGNKAAGTRVRQAMQQIKDAAQDVRRGILEMRGSEQAGQAAEGGEAEGKKST
ncbi:MAG: histone H1 [Phycisphaerales bacterium]|nr:histone H1 [Phycisphaerales bacterium]